MAKRLVERLACLLKETADADVLNVQTKGKRVDEHTHRIGNLEVAAAAADRAEIDLAIVRVAGDDVSRRGKEEMRRRDVMLSAESCHLVEVGKTNSLADEALLVVTMTQVGRYLAGSFAGLQLLCKETLCLAELLGVFRCLLVGHEVEVRVRFLLYRLAFEPCAYLTDKQVGRATVEDKVMDVHEQMDGALRLDYLEAIKRRFLQVEGLHELILVARQSLIRHLGNRHLGRHAVLQGLDDGVAFRSEMHAEFGMAFHNSLDRLGKLACFCACGEGQQVRNVIDRRRGILQAIEVDACLGIAQGSRVCLMG